MRFTLENAYLSVAVESRGAQVASVVRKCDGVEHIWQADPAVWGYHAPVLFPYAGKLKDGRYELDGTVYESPAQHGFARTLEHTCVQQDTESLTLRLTQSAQTEKTFPFRFRFDSEFRLCGDTLAHTLRVVNMDEKEMPFGIGYHPAFALPFDGTHTARDYELRFSDMESPLCLDTQPRGLLSGSCYRLGTNLRTIPIDGKLFANDSHCMVGLRSRTLGVYEKDTGRAVVCEIGDFPYTLIWSKPGEPKFVCIEPWHSLPDAEDADGNWRAKPAAAVLAPGESWSTTLRTQFVR